ncbi:MAG TPA: amino acid adenylation domain-containing protein, partial [Candidatus Deferrimicrobium sp.]|nr:amino acid adenylation domain-containing protein [Candidatus Deferrimicrobium sp.]
PSYFVNIEKIPLTANGKINRMALPDPRENSLEDNIECMPPQNAVEKILAEIWTKVLGRENVGINQNFFAIGGDSIKSIQIISRMSSAGYKLEMKDIFQYPLISDLAPRIKKMKRFPDQSTVAGTIPLTPIQETFFNESHIEPYHYNQSVMLYSKDGFKKEAIKEVFSRIQEHHDALRMTYQMNNENGEIIQIAHGLDYPISLQEYDLRNGEKCFEELNTKANVIQAGINLENGPMMHLGLFHLEDGDRLLIAIHHLVIDGVSWRILFEDIETLYKQYQRGEKLVLPPKSDSFKLWSEELTVYANSKTFLKEKTYWQNIESVEAPLIPKDFEVDDNYVKDTGSVSFTIGEEETNLLLTKVNGAYKTEINDILLTALGMGMKKTFGHDRVLVALEGHGREEILEGIDIGRTVGWFTSLYPVVMDISYSDHPGRQSKEIKEILRQIPNKGIGYGILKYLTGEENKKEIEFTLKPQISFNYLGQFDADVKQLSSFEMAKESAGYWQSLNNRREYLLDVSGMTADNRLTMTVSYNKTHFKPGTMSALAGNFEAELRQLIAFCCTIESIEHTPSDFTYKGLTIERIDRLTALYPDLEDLYTLTPMQEGMLYHALSDNSSYFYFEQMSYRLLGELDICRVEKSLNELFKRHDILRTAFVYEDIERPVQVVLKDRTSDFYYEDIIENRDREGKEVFIAEFKEKDKKRSFELSKGALMRVSIIRLDNSEYEFTWSFHHILMDGWCIGILNKEFFEIYSGYLENRPYRLPAVKPYRAYIQWLEKQDKEESARYWENYLDSYEGQSGVPRIQPMKKGETGYRKGTVALEFDMEKTAGLNRLAAVNHVTLNIVTQALWGILLGKYNGKEDVVFGAVVSGRPSELEGVESMVGLFINTIPVRVRFEEKMEFYRLLRQIREEALAGEPYHYHPLAEIQARTSLRHNLIDHLLVFENYPIVDQIDGHEKEKSKSSRFPLKIRNIDVFEQNNYNFTVSLSATDRLTIIFKYNNNVYDRDNVEMVAGHFKLLFNQVIENRGLEIRDLTILSAEEKSRVLYEFNGTEMDYPTNKTIQQLFEEQAERTPDHIITVGTGGETKKGSKEAVHLSYRELNNRSNRTANRLMAKDVKPGAIIGIMVEPTLEMVVGITGILKAGGVFLPIEPGSPVDRVNCVLEDSNAGILLTQVHLPAAFKTNIEIIHVEDGAVNTGESPNIINGTGPADPLYVIYTSGTTGKPKGVLIAHKNIVNYVYWFVQTIKLTANDRAILTSSFAFDALYTQFFSSLLTGCELHVIPRETFLFAERLLNYLRKNKITYIKVTPSLFNLIADSPGFTAEMLRGLRFVMLGGEAINVQDVEKAHERCPHLRMMNHYGPTETTIGSIARFLDFDNFEEYKSVPTIGKPLNNTHVYILDKSFNMVPIGVVGGLFIEGDGVGMGYLNRPELTAERFLKNNRSYGSYRTYVLYCTGDLARWHSDGNIEFLGRADHQVKIRGYRIEPGEIENRLLKYDNVKEAVVLVREKKNGEKYLCAYYVSGKEIEAALLHEFLSAGLPQPMVPSYFVHLEKLPLTRHNKLNRGALPEPLTESEGGSGYAAPGDEVQVKLVEIWASVLGIEKSIIGIDDNFFQLGGHSLKSVLLVAKIHKELNTKIPLEEVFRTPTIKGLAGYIRDAGRDEYAAIEPVEEKEYYELSHAQKRLWVLNRLEKDLIAYNIPAHIEFENLNRGAFEKTVEIIVRRHEILRTTFITVNGEPKQKIHHYEDLDATVDYIDLRKEKDGEKTIKTLMDKEKNTPFNLETGPLFRIRMLHAEENRILVLYTLHHIISDGWSMDVMKNEFM